MFFFVVSIIEWVSYKEKSFRAQSSSPRLRGYLWEDLLDSSPKIHRVCGMSQWGVGVGVGREWMCMHMCAHMNAHTFSGFPL